MAEIKYKSLEKIQYDFLRDVSYTFDNVLGSYDLENEKQDLMDSLLFLFCQQIKEIENEHNDFSFPNSIPYFNHPFINLYFVNPPSNSLPVQNNFNYQPLATSMIPFNPYNFTNAQFQYPMIPQPYPQPSFIYTNYPSITNEQRTKTSDKSKKKSDKKSHHKSSKKSKHHKKHDKAKSKDSESKKTPSQIETFTIKSPNSLDGIINYLNKKTGGNVHDNGTIEVTSNSILDQSCHPKVLLKKGTNTRQYAAVRGEKNAWISFDFKNMEIQITDYMIRNASSCNMKNWVLEISDDGNKWKVIDERMNCTDLNSGQFKVNSFKVEKSSFARFCRIRHCGEFNSYLTSNAMQISGIEFYGKLKIYS